MRPGQNKRMRGRPNNTGTGGNRKGPNPLTRSFESNGPDVKIRGNAHHVAEKYLQLARDAQSSGDPVAAESYLQHAEHYFRLIASAQAAQAGYVRQPDAVDTDGEDDDDSGIPDRFASPQMQAPAPFVAPAPPQAYVPERQPYSEGRQQTYNGQNGGERQPYGDRQVNGERPQYGDRNSYQQRQDRNGLNRRAYRDNGGGSEMRSDDRQGQDRGQGDRGQNDRVQTDRAQPDRVQQDRSAQDRPYQDRQSRRDRFAQERNGQDRGTQQDRGFDRQQGERYRDATFEPQRDAYAGEQPRIEATPERQPDVVQRSAWEPVGEPSPRIEMEAPAQPVARAEPVVRTEPVSRAEPARRRERVERTGAQVSDEAPGLPSFITTPTRVAPPDAASAPAQPNLATTTAFPGDEAEEAPKFPRRRRRTTRASAAEGGEAGEQPTVTTGD